MIKNKLSKYNNRFLNRFSSATALSNIDTNTTVTIDDFVVYNIYENLHRIIILNQKEYSFRKTMLDHWQRKFHIQAQILDKSKYEQVISDYKGRR